MPSSPDQQKFATHGTFGHSPKFTAIRDDLAASAAFLSLKPTAALILLDFIKHYNAATNWDRDESKLTKPIIYSFGMCALLVSKNTFHQAMRALQLHGFVIDFETSSSCRGRATRWLATTRWRSWSPDHAQLRLLNSYSHRRSSSCQNPDQLRFPFVTYLRKEKAAAESTAPNVTHVSQHTAAIVEEIWTQNASHHQARRATR